MYFVYPAVIKKVDDDMYHADFPDLEGCHAEGTSLDDCLDNAIQAAHGWLYVELTEFEGDLPCVSDPDDLDLDEGEFVRDISVNIRITDGWDE